MAQMRMRQSMAQIELAFEQEMALERRRREQLRKRAVNRSRARRISRNESKGKVRFSVLLVCLTITVVTVVVTMFEALAWLMAASNRGVAYLGAAREALERLGGGGAGASIVLVVTLAAALLGFDSVVDLVPEDRDVSWSGDAQTHLLAGDRENLHFDPSPTMMLWPGLRVSTSIAFPPRSTPTPGGDPASPTQKSVAYKVLRPPCQGGRAE